MPGPFYYRIVKYLRRISTAILCALPLVLQAADTKKIVLIAGKPSHGPLQHEHNAGSLLFQRCLASVPNVEVIVYQNGWPTVANPFEGADSIVFFVTGGKAHEAIKENRLSELRALMEKGVGFGAIHYGVEVPKENGGAEFLDWMGGYFETHWSVNPHWDAEFKLIPEHPITRGVKPFTINDEWYFHMRFQPGMKGVTPILSARAPASTMKRGDGAHSGNPAVRESVAAGAPQHVAWAYERPNGGRGFGFTGAHNHLNWGNPNFRKVVLNALLWISKAEVPQGGVDCDVTDEDLMLNLDPKKGQRPRVRSRSDLRKQQQQQFISPTLGK